MSKYKLCELRDKKRLDIINLTKEIAELEKQIGLISAEDWVMNQNFITNTCESLAISGFKAGEQNDRKRTQPVIDAAKILVKVYHQTVNTGPSWTPLVETLKTLDEYDSQV